MDGFEEIYLPNTGIHAAGLSNNLTSSLSEEVGLEHSA
ncbi:Uncharacterised protein [Niallia circulans]|nr:Uncharacterised protein [Niallia circulans]